MNPYSNFVGQSARLVQDAKTLPLGGFAPAPQPPIAPGAPKALFFAPHPDDESIGGGLALRLLRQANWNIINVAVTLGSLEERKVSRLAELRGSCDYLAFGLELPEPHGLDNVRAATRTSDSSNWARMVSIIVSLLEKHRPAAIFFPHQLDWNSTHVGVHLLVTDALQAARGLECYLVETEFWGELAKPNLLVEYAQAEVADLVAATSFHAGEVQRNPYHLLIPAWMQDAVRRGAERVGGQGRPAPSFVFAQLFQLRRWQGGQLQECQPGGRFLSASENPSVLFP